jgi:hypothetical protein
MKRWIGGDLGEDGLAPHAGQVEVEDDEVRLRLVEIPEGCEPVCRDIHVKPGEAQERAIHRRERDIIFDDEDPGLCPFHVQVTASR